MSLQQVALGSGGSVRARLVMFLIALAVVMWMAHQQTEAGEVTRGILEWLANAAGAFVTLIRSLFG